MELTLALLLSSLSVVSVAAPIRTLYDPTANPTPNQLTDFTMTGTASPPSTSGSWPSTTFQTTSFPTNSYQSISFPSTGIQPISYPRFPIPTGSPSPGMLPAPGIFSNLVPALGSGSSSFPTPTPTPPAPYQKGKMMIMFWNAAQTFGCVFDSIVDSGFLHKLPVVGSFFPDPAGTPKCMSLLGGSRSGASQVGGSLLSGSRLGSPMGSLPFGGTGSSSSSPFGSFGSFGSSLFSGSPLGGSGSY